MWPEGLGLEKTVEGARHRIEEVGKVLRRYTGPLVEKATKRTTENTPTSVVQGATPRTTTERGPSDPHRFRGGETDHDPLFDGGYEDPLAVEETVDETPDN